MEIAKNLSKTYGVRKVVPLQVSAPFHSPLLQESEEIVRILLHDALRRGRLCDSPIPLISNFNGKWVTSKDELVHVLTAQTTKTINFWRCVQVSFTHFHN